MMRRVLLLCVCLYVPATFSFEFQQFIKGNNRFTAEVYKKIANSQENFMVSPVSIRWLMALMDCGAQDETSKELRAAIQTTTKSDIDRAMPQLLQIINKKEAFTLHRANKIYVKNGFSLNPIFVQFAQDIYQSPIEQISFSNQRSASQKINTWVEHQTNHKINNLISAEEINRYTRAILVSALYLQANWSQTFDGYLTMPSKFQTFSNLIKIDTMRLRNANLKYLEIPQVDAKFLELPLSGDRLSMVISLPNQLQGFQLIERQLEVLLNMPLTQTETVNVDFPKFKFETKLNYKNILKQLGVRRAFKAGEADFSGIAGKKGDLFIKNIVQKTFINVNEEGIEAAAASYVDAIVPLMGHFPVTPPKNFIVDHPFIFWIKCDDIILFIGKVSRPMHEK